MIYGEARVKWRENEIQPFARISITNTHQKNEGREDTERKTQGNRKTCEENKGGREGRLL